MNKIKKKNLKHSLPQNWLEPSIFYLTSSSPNIFASPLTLLSIVAFRYESLISTICDYKDSVQLKYQS